MSVSRRTLSGWLLTILAAVYGTLVAARDPSEPPISLGGPEVFKLDRNTRAIIAADLDGNGYPDLALINNDRAKIEILYQYGPDEPREVRAETGTRWRPVLDDSRFRHDGVVTGIQMYALAAGDLNGDGRPDLAFTGKPDGLVVLFGGKKAGWDERWRYSLETPNQWRSSLAISDLNGDGRSDLLMLGKEALLVFPQDASGALKTPRRYPLADAGSYGPAIADVNGDGMNDVLYLVPNSRYALRLRLRGLAGDLGPERTYRFETPRSELAAWGPDGVPAEFVAVQSQSGLIERFALEPVASRTKADPVPAPQVYAVPGDATTAGSYALGDVDGDSRLDVLVADQKGARVWVYRQLDDGTFSKPTSFPSFSDIRSVSAADTDGDGRAELYVASQAEEAVGVASMLPTGRLSYPEPLPVDGKPLVLSLVRTVSGTRWDLACVLRRGKLRALVVLSRDPATGEWQAARELVLEGMRTDPTGLKPVDLDRDGLIDLVAFDLRTPAWLLHRQTDGSFKAVGAGGGLRHGLLDKLQPGDLSVGDVDQDGTDEMIVVGKGYARAMQMDASGALAVVDQFNAIDREAEIASALPLDADGDGHNELFLLPRSGDELQLLRHGPDTVYRPWLSLEMGRIDLVDTRVLPPNGIGAGRILYLGKDRFWLVPVGAGGLEVSRRAIHETDLEDMQYSELALGDLNGDGQPELVALDNKETRILEVLQREGTGGWRSALHFEVFEEHGREEYQGTTKEPRELLVTDMTGDGRADILLLVHDRLLLYPSR
jgi:hypothetical protein